eukprot:GHVU01037234.1.p1 GENE.GHVU01037234.1~~GHVU01037234.1.p1  ORF type:complete len:181 (-),score=12.40 GHVU01037234.1:56-598(-)
MLLHCEEEEEEDIKRKTASNSTVVMRTEHLIPQLENYLRLDVSTMGQHYGYAVVIVDPGKQARRLWCHLKGNMLFTSASHERLSNVSAFLLEHCDISDCSETERRPGVKIDWGAIGSLSIFVDSADEFEPWMRNLRLGANTLTTLGKKNKTRWRVKERKRGNICIATELSNSKFANCDRR